MEIKHHTQKFTVTQRRIYKISSNTDKKASMRATAKIWGARASEHSFKFCEQLKIFMDHSSPLQITISAVQAVSPKLML